MFEKIKNKIFDKEKEVVKDNFKKDPQEYYLTTSLADNIQIFKEIFAKDDTVNFRSIENGSGSVKCCLIYIDGMVQDKIINTDIMRPIMKCDIQNDIITNLENKIINSGDIKRVSDISEMIAPFLYGKSILLIEGYAEGLVIGTIGWEHRSISEPVSENVVKGPREGFTESMNVNLTLIRRKILNPDLKIEYKEIGTQTKTKVSIVYIDDIANPKIVEEVHKRLDEIDIDGILGSNYIDELIKDAPYSPFDTIGSTERPDVVAGELLEGRIAIVVDGVSYVLTLPFIFVQYLQTNEDYYVSYYYGTFNRLLRLLAFFITTSVPAIYVALITYHQELIPTPLVVSITAANEGTPFPSFFECTLLLLVFEILREGGVRIPTPVGPAISIVGALVLGEAAVSARFFSAPMVIIVAISGITGLMLPKMLSPLIYTRTILLILAGFLGLYGYMFGIIGLFIHLASIRSFGIPYLLHLGSLKGQDLQDTAIRAPWWYMKLRPKLIAKRNQVRQGAQQKAQKGR
ncbi:spore germination protein KA [Desulfonispora thiosulfatigenes DSM 11270]|uniref:Spore germination protein KA n=1 Tax=Desulfonispora thiosulfatigenes DSM 11270 TaxID=656914 RepID=A0A1W1V4K4_DESTI|nr:spore germination protein [Desulfonispora thiosulfatigenes]SMB87951.1 spore germination protein KA [Desulfonispora thiosulfatigenes DSM 11270]